MKARKIILGCSAVAIVVIILSLIAIVVTWRRMTARMATAEPVALVDAGTRGFAAMRLAPGDPLVAEILSRHPDFKDADPNEFLPASLLWLSHGSASGPAGQSLVLSMEPRGRMLGLIADFSLWKAGRGSSERVARVEHGGEGITSFPGTGLKGSLFVRGNSFVWSSDVDTARHMVDLMNGSRAAGETVARFMPEPALHGLSGAITEEGGALATALAFLPGTDLDLTPEQTAGIAAMAFALDAQPGDSASGEIHVYFEPDVTAERRAQVTADLAARISRLAIEGVTLQTAPRQEPDRGVIALNALGVSAIAERLKTAINEAFAWLQRLEREGA